LRIHLKKSRNSFRIFLKVTICSLLRRLWATSPRVPVTFWGNELIASSPNQQLRRDGMKSEVLPIEGIHYVEIYVGNAKQASYLYQNGFGYTPTAFAGPDMGHKR